MELDVGFEDIEDLLVCGACQRNFPLGNIVNFIQHKKFDCADGSIAGLMCQSCPQQFGTPWSLLKHAQTVHALKIYLETGPFLSTITKVSYFSEKQSVTSKTSANNTDVENNRSNMQELSSLQQLQNSLFDRLNVLPASSLDSTTRDQCDNAEFMQPPMYSNISEHSEGMPQAEHLGQKTSLSSDSGNIENISGNRILQAGSKESCTEDVENISGQTAVLEKCCTSVLPKKRKRHMEIKHAGSRKRVPIVSSSPTSIFIDLEPGAEAHTFQASVSHDSLQDPVTFPESVFSKTLRPSVRRHSVIIQPGMTFSIPVSHASVSLAPSCKYPIVANSVTAHGTNSSEYNSSAEVFHQANDAVASEPTTTDTLTYQLPQELTGTGAADQQRSSADEHLRDGLLDEEGGRGRTLEHKRRRYPTSRPFKCDQCDNAFNQRIHLKKHQSKHTGVKPFKCDQCDYSTVERSHLKVHIRVHTGEKPYKCTYCEYATAQNSTLKIHLRRHHHEPVDTEAAHASAAYVCSKCGQQFEERDTYQCHDAEQHTSTSTPMQSVSSEHHVASDAECTDNLSIASL